MIDERAFTIDAEAVVVHAEHPLRVVSSAIVGGGLSEARTIVNLHVCTSFRCQESERLLADFVHARGLATPFVGLLTGARTEAAQVAVERRDDLSAWALVTVGLGNRSAAGRSDVAVWRPSTINTIVLVEAEPEPAALINLVVTVTEAKALALAEAGVRSADGELVTGTSTDAVVIAATGNGPRCRFGGPVSELGWVVARAARSALDAGIARWMSTATSESRR